LKINIIKNIFKKVFFYEGFGLSIVEAMACESHGNFVQKKLLKFMKAC
jgi:hypothetical protein